MERAGDRAAGAASADRAREGAWTSGVLLVVDAPLIGLHLAADGSLQPPPASESNLAGWYAEGTSPGETGTAVVTGHVDTARGPAAFFRLVELAPGAEIAVERADRTVVRFAVDSVVAYPKSAFPSGLVYSPAPRPELRVITCGGPYDRTRGGYRDNVVVSAHLDSVVPGPAGGS